jgi:hypothetical protein
MFRVVNKKPTINEPFACITQIIISIGFTLNHIESTFLTRQGVGSWLQNHKKLSQKMLVQIKLKKLVI